MALVDEAGFKESEHPRGQPGNAGQFASSSGGGTGIESSSSKGSSAKPIKRQPDFKGSLAHETSGDTTQPVKSLDELYERATKAEPAFKSAIKDVAERYGAEARFQGEGDDTLGASLKTRESSERKLRDELGGDFTKLRDVMRATVVWDTNEATRKAAADFIGEQGDSILRVKDRIMNPFAGGYRDILINYRTPEGIVAEIQFNSKNMVAAKQAVGHKIYKQARALLNPTPEDLLKFEQQMATIYEGAYMADGDGKGWKHEGEQVQAHDSVGNEVLRRYRLTSPDKETFEAAIVSKGGVLSVLTNKSGMWLPDESLSYADLVMPEQALEDWSVEKLAPSNLENSTPSKTNDRRPVFDVNDIEYYTAESLGPNRERTPEGFLICYDVPAARIGEMVYGPGEVPMELGLGLDGRVRVTRSAAEVFDRRSMASLNGKPVTDDHPPVDVDPTNWQFYTKGTVVSPRRGEGDKDDFLLVNLIIYDGELIKDIESGKREVSCGYNPEYLQVLDPETMEPIQGRGEQVQIRYNHLALVKAGRCGPHCAIGDRKTVDTVQVDGDPFFSPERARRFKQLMKRLS
jgi:Uncharacterized protein conserved in bacteria (DUF2213)